VAARDFSSARSRPESAALSDLPWISRRLNQPGKNPACDSPSTLKQEVDNYTWYRVARSRSVDRRRTLTDNARFFRFGISLLIADDLRYRLRKRTSLFGEPQNARAKVARACTRH
jgi:hypothetical protein